MLDLPMVSISKEEALPETSTTTTTTITSAGSKRKVDEIDYIYISDSDEKKTDKDDSTSVEKKNDEEKYDMFSEESKRKLSARVSKCLCGRWRICSKCDEEFPHESRKTADNSPPELCKRDCEEGSECTDDYTSLPILPCVVCKCMTDGGEVSTDWHLDCEQCELLICEQGVCPGCLGALEGVDICKDCKWNCDI